MDKVLSFIRLEQFKGSRTQYTVIAGLLLNALVTLGFISLTPEQLETANKFLLLIGSLFFAEKVSK